MLACFGFLAAKFVPVITLDLQIPSKQPQLALNYATHLTVAPTPINPCLGRPVRMCPDTVALNWPEKCRRCAASSRKPPRWPTEQPRPFSWDRFPVQGQSLIRHGWLATFLLIPVSSEIYKTAINTHRSKLVCRTLTYYLFNVLFSRRPLSHSVHP